MRESVEKGNRRFVHRETGEVAYGNPDRPPGTQYDAYGWPVPGTFEMWRATDEYGNDFPPPPPWERDAEDRPLNIPSD